MNVRRADDVGYGFSRNGGNFHIILTTGIEIRTLGELILAKSLDFGRFEWSGKVKNRSFAGQVNIDLPTLKPGDYEIVLTLSDLASKKTANVTIPLTIAAE